MADVKPPSRIQTIFDADNGTWKAIETQFVKRAAELWQVLEPGASLLWQLFNDPVVSADQRLTFRGQHTFTTLSSTSPTYRSLSCPAV